MAELKITPRCSGLCIVHCRDAAAAERERFLAVLAEHYLMTIICNEETHQDNPVCGCSRVFLGWHPSIGAARQAYINHVAHVLDGDDA